MGASLAQTPDKSRSITILCLKPSSGLPFSLLVNNVPGPVISRLRAAVVTALLACAACGSSDRPSTTADTSSELITGEVDPIYAPSPPAAGEPGRPVQTCSPRSARECRWYYVDPSGQPQCPMSYQLCKVDGSDWLPCGEYRIGESGDPELAD